jgi:hypothetical protein
MFYFVELDNISVSFGGDYSIEFIYRQIVSGKEKKKRRKKKKDRKDRKDGKDL